MVHICNPCFCDGGCTSGFLVTSVSSVPAMGGGTVFLIEQVVGLAAEGLVADFTYFTLRLRSDGKE